VIRTNEKGGMTDTKNRRGRRRGGRRRASRLRLRGQEIDEAELIARQGSDAPIAMCDTPRTGGLRKQKKRDVERGYQ
jgi:hypothetical protein